MLNVLLQPYFEPKAIDRRYFLMLHAALQYPHEIKLDKTWTPLNASQKSTVYPNNLPPLPRTRHTEFKSNLIKADFVIKQ